MKAILLKEFGPPENLYIGEYSTPKPTSNEILVKVAATALNRADTMQRKGNYPPPPGASPILGLEMAGEIVGLGSAVTTWEIGDKVCGLLSGGGYAEYAVIHEDLAIPIPKDWTYEKAAAIPEVFLTAFQALSWLAQLKKGERLLIHAGASGVGTAATQLAKAIGVSVMVTASAGKHELCKSLGVEKAIDYKNEDFEKVVMDYTDGKGVDVIVDFIAAPYFQKNLNLLSTDGRLVMLSLIGGVKTEANLIPILRKRLKIMGSTLRARSLEYKRDLTKDLWHFAGPLFETQQLKPVIDSVYDWNEVAEAHRYMEANKNQGKIILKIN